MKCSNKYILLLIFLCFNQCKGIPWVSLIERESLINWEIKNGTAKYLIEDRQIIGITKFGTPNTFLITKKMYSDFILEFEVLVDSTINSGVQIRSKSKPDYNKGLVHGYQVEIDPSKRSWSGGIYDEGRRGWLYNLENNPTGRTAFKNGEWNHYRVEALGNHIIVWVNGINTANLEDAMTAKGFIGLQVHSVGDSIDSGKEIRWRNINIITDEPNRYSQADKITATLIKIDINK